MTDEQKKQNDLFEEFRQLGENLVNALRGVWESPERKRLQQEIEAGLAEVSNSVKKEADTFKESPTGQRLKSDIEDLRERINSGEIEANVREELLKSLQFINNELRKISGRSSQDIPPNQGTDTSQTKEE